MTALHCTSPWLGLVETLSFSLCIWFSTAPANAATHYQRLKAFGPTSDGQYPQAPLIQESDGAFYGTTSWGGTGGWGTAFKLNRDGSGYTVLHSFTGGGDGSAPDEGLMEGSDLALFGRTTDGGSSGVGTIFRLRKDGGGYQVLHDFATDEAGQFPSTGLIEASDRFLYGTCSGGTSNSGTIFRLSKDGSGYQVLHTFGDSGADGRYPNAGLVEAGDAALYGTTSAGGNSNLGTVFKINKDGSGYVTLHYFGGTIDDGQNPTGGLTVGSDGALYGTTLAGGPYTNPVAGGPYTNILGRSLGTIFKLRLDGNGYSVLHSFAGTRTGDSEFPAARLVEGSDGALYGTTPGFCADWHCTSSIPGVVFRIGKDGAAYQILVSDYGIGALIQGRDRSLYGTIFYDGGCCGWAYSRVFKVNVDGSGYSTLYDFGGSDISRPGLTSGPLALGSDGALYGRTYAGGDSYVGTLFKIWPPETPDLISVARCSGTLEVSFAGVEGYAYQVLRSSDLTNWIVLAAVTMPSSGTYTNVDNSPPTSRAYYRAAWLP